MSKGGGGTRDKSPNKNAYYQDLAQEQLREFTHGGGYFGQTLGEFSVMDLALSGAKNDMVLWRASDTEELKSMLKDTGINNIENFKKAEGKEFTSKYFKSTSTNKKSAEQYLGDTYDRQEPGNFTEHPVMFRFNVSKGTPVAERNDGELARGANGEHTLGRNVSMKIKSIKRENKWRYDNDYADGKAWEYVVEIDVKKK